LHENKYLGTMKTGNNLDCHIILLRMLPSLPIGTTQQGTAEVDD